MNYGYGIPYQQTNPMIYNQQQRIEPYYQQQVQSRGLDGRIVENVNEVAASEVNMNGSPCVFIKNDLSEIYIKRWNQSGTIDTSVYKIFQDIPEVNIDNKPGNVIQDKLDSFQEKLVTIEEKLNKVLDSKQTTSTRGGAKS